MDIYKAKLKSPIGVREFRVSSLNHLQLLSNKQVRLKTLRVLMSFCQTNSYQK